MLAKASPSASRSETSAGAVGDEELCDVERAFGFGAFGGGEGLAGMHTIQRRLQTGGYRVREAPGQGMIAVVKCEAWAHT